MLNCTGGTIDDSNFGKPMPIIGLYIAGATLVCTILMVIDLIKGFKSKQYWIPANYFSINAASLTVIGVAIKLSVDLNSSMPSRMDQVAKLATSAFICVVLANYIPFSVGKLKRGDRRANTIALELIILTSAVNLCIQLKSGVIHAFRGAHIFMIVLMFVFLFMCCLTSSINLPLLWLDLQRQFEKMHQQALKESFGDSVENIKDGMKLKEYLMKFSMMAQSGCPHIFLIRSPACIVVATYGLMSASAFAFGALATITHRDQMVGLNTCSGESDYGWSVLVILVTQAIAIVTGLVAPLSRMIYLIKARAVGHTSSNYLAQLPFDLLTFMIVMAPSVANVRTSSNQHIQNSNGLRPYFLHSEEEEEGSIEFMVESCSRVIQKYINAETEKPENLIRFLKDKLISHDFGGVLLFEGDLPPVISYSDGPPTSSWALPMVTLICIAAALPQPSRSDLPLKEIMEEGLVYVELVEDILNGMDDYLMIRLAVTRSVHNSFTIFSRWLSGVNHYKLSRKCKGPKEALFMLVDSVEKRFPKIDNAQDLIDSDNPDAVAAHSMYRICQTILQYYENNPGLSEDGMFDMLCKWTADILGACFTNLRECIFQACKRSRIEDRRETAFRMLKLFGITEEIMKILEENGMKIPDLPSEKLASIDEWRLYLAVAGRG